MKFFKKNLKAFEPNHLAVKAVNSLSILQARIADRLNRKTKDFTRGQQLWFLALTCLVLGGGSLYLLIKVFI
jgi:hypothetical protein